MNLGILPGWFLEFSPHPLPPFLSLPWRSMLANRTISPNHYLVRQDCLSFFRHGLAVREGPLEPEVRQLRLEKTGWFSSQQLHRCLQRCHDNESKAAHLLRPHVAMIGLANSVITPYACFLTGACRAGCLCSTEETQETGSEHF